MKVHSKFIKIFGALLVAALLFAALPAGDAIAQTTINVCPAGSPTCDYATIQAAINASTAGDIIQVQAGTYTENVTINKDVTVQGLNDPEGANAAVVNGLVYVTDDGATLESLKIVPGNVSGQKAGVPPA